jgi:hypothetical protein
MARPPAIHVQKTRLKASLTVSLETQERAVDWDRVAGADPVGDDESLWQREWKEQVAALCGLDDPVERHARIAEAVQSLVVHYHQRLASVVLRPTYGDLQHHPADVAAHLVANLESAACAIAADPSWDLGAAVDHVVLYTLISLAAEGE